MSKATLNALAKTLSPHLKLRKSRMDTLLSILTGMIVARTVNLSHLAGHIPNEAKHSSNYRRCQRFFEHIHLDDRWLAQCVVKLLGLSPPWIVAIDRTNWKVGTKDINYFVPRVS